MLWGKCGVLLIFAVVINEVNLRIWCKIISSSKPKISFKMSPFGRWYTAFGFLAICFIIITVCKLMSVCEFMCVWRYIHADDQISVKHIKEGCTILQYKVVHLKSSIQGNTLSKVVLIILALMVFIALHTLPTPH